MARIRTIKPEIWMSPQVMNLSHGARLLFLGLITQADDEGIGIADPRKLKAAIFGGDDITSADVRRMLDEISAQRLAVLYEDASHGNLYQLPSWKSHQSIDRPRKSVYPSPTVATNPPPHRRTLDESDTRPREGSDRTGPEWKGREGSVARARAREPGEGNHEPDQGPSATWSDEAQHREWVQTAALYPPNPARADWIGAEKAAREIVERGDATWDLLRAGVTRYAKHCEATGRMVLNPVKFFTDRDRPWSQAWPTPAAGNGKQPRMRTAHEIAEALDPDNTALRGP